MLPEEERERPRAVTIIGRVWLVVAVLSLCKVLVNLAIWKVLEPAAPSLFGNVVAETPSLWLVRPALEHVTLLMTAQAVWWIAVGVSAFELLRLRPWAPVAMQVVGWAVLAYITVFGVFWLTVVWRVPAPGAGGRAFGNPAHGTLVLVGGLAGCALVAAGLITMIASLRSTGVREAFRHGSNASPAAERSVR